MSRRALEEIFVGQSSYTSSNLLRAVRSLVRMRLVYLQEGPDLDRSHVLLPRPAKRMSDDEVFVLLTQQATDAEASR